jgi:radical SAM superfamily enzyme YgiQ (UPF0313 family)
VALAYPSPYAVGMSSLGFQQVYRLLNALPDTVAERAFVPDEAHGRDAVLTYESQRPISDYPVVAISLAYELELEGVFTLLSRAGIPLLSRQRNERHPWIVVGGPLTFSNPSPVAPFADVVVMGEAEDLLAPLCDTLFSGMSRQAILNELAARPGFYVPALHGAAMPSVAQCDDAQLPAHSAVLTADTVLSDKFLVETERGCSRGCTFCVMRRSTNGGMRLASIERILEVIPEAARKVGFVGAAVSDHPRIVPLLRAVVDGGREVALSSLRADRLTPDFVELLVRGGGRTLTIASDGASERLRQEMEKKIKEKHLLRAAEMAGAHGVTQLKNYMMIGVPGETDDDLDELIAFTRRQADAAGPRTKVVLGIATFVAKRNTPLDGAPFIGVREADRRLDRLRRGLMPRIEVRSTSARWAFVEYLLAQGGPAAGLAAHTAWAAGGGYAAYKRAFGVRGGDAMPDAMRLTFDGATGFA